MSVVRSFVEACLARRARVGVVGDSMVDEYYNVTANRVSPEFPIPVLLLHSDQPEGRLPGGAANVCHQLSRVPCSADLASVLSPYARDVLASHAVDFSPSEVESRAVVPVKKRFYQGDMPLSRHDHEEPDYGLPPHVLEGIRDRIREGRGGPHEVLILSDYGKGMFTDLASRSKWTLGGTPTIVDPKKGPVESWKGCSVFKPNAVEAESLSGERCWRAQARFFADRLSCGGVVITRGGSGVVGFDGRAGGEFEIGGDRAVAARSVIGAGDCFAAFLALAFAHGFGVRDCAEVAFKAGAVYVQNVRNRPVSLYELLRYEDPIAAKYMDPVVGPGEKLVFVNGVHDLLHVGHAESLRFARGKGDRLVVALNSDASARRLKGPSRPVIPLEDRMRMVASLEFVDFVTSFDEDTPLECLRRVRPDVLVKGADYAKKEVVGADLVKEVHLCPLVDGVSTTAIVNHPR